MAELSIAADTVFRLIEILHELAGQDQGLERDDADEGGDDAAAQGLAGGPDDARMGEVATLLHDLNIDERCDLLALMLLGRGDYDLDGWDEAKAEALERLSSENLQVVVDAVSGDAASAEFLEAGLDAFGYSFAEWDAETVLAQPGAGGASEPCDVTDDAQRRVPGRVDTR
jgi:Protein of unknown function (DUF3775)